VNIPAYTLDVLRGDTLVRRFRVAVGLRKDPTPVGTFAITEITWNPWWHPPNSDWAKKDTIMPPGPRNPMGRVKLLIGGLYYVHGTPLAASIGHAASHGCMRMRQSDALALAALIMASDRQAVPVWAPGDTTPLAAQTVVMTLRHAVPVVARYATAVVHGDSLTLYPDVYHRAPAGVDQVAAVLAESRLDTSAVNHGRLASLVKRAARKPVTVALSAIGVVR